VLFQELDVAMAEWHHSASAIHYPHLGLDCTMGQLMVIMGGLDDVDVDDIDINDAHVTGRRRKIRWLELWSLPRRNNGGGRSVATNWVGRQRRRRGSDAKHDKERR
jgi:hypothetical protein